MNRRREEKRREFHEALLRTLYPPPSPPTSPPPPVVDAKPFDVTLVDPEDYVKTGSSENEIDEDESDNIQKMSRAKRKRLRKKMLKEEAVRRRKLIGPLLPSTMADTETHYESEIGCSDGDGSGEQQSVRGNVKEKSSGGDKMRKIKKRREAKKRLKESSNGGSEDLGAR